MIESILQNRSVYLDACMLMTITRIHTSQKDNVHADRSQRVIKINLCTLRKLCGIYRLRAPLRRIEDTMNMKVYSCLIENVEKHEESSKNKNSKSNM